MIYMLVHKLFFGPKFDSVLETDSNGFFLVRKDLPSDCKPYAHLPKPLVQNSLLIFSIEPSGKTTVYKDGKWEEGYHNGICALLENYPPVIQTAPSLTGTDITIPALSDLSSVAKCENLNLKRLLNRDLKKLVLQDPKFRHLPKSTDFLQAWSEMSDAYRSLTHAISKDTVTLMGDSRFPTGYRDKDGVEEGKGEFGLRCNVTACQTPGQAFFWNLGTSAYYCFHCAKEIRDANLREADLFPEITKLTRLHEVNMVRVPLKDLKTPGSDLGEIQWLK